MFLRANASQKILFEVDKVACPFLEVLLNYSVQKEHLSGTPKVIVARYLSG